MNQNPNIPSLNPADTDTLAGMVRSTFKKLQEDVNVMLPAKVVAFNRSLGRATVQAQIAIVGTGGQILQRAAIASVPVFQFGAGGFLISCNCNTGDIGWIKAADRDLTLFYDTYSSSVPNTNRIHDFADSVFFPHVMTGFTIDEADVNNLVIQNLDGSIKISLGESKITIKAPDVVIDSDVEITGDLQVDNDLQVNGGLNVQERLVVQGDIASGGNITAAGSITPDTPIPP